MKLNHFKRLGVAAISAALLITVTGLHVTHAATAAIGQFYAGCNNFSIDVTVFGNTDDGGGQDKFRYLITDSNNKTLYQEDARDTCRVEDS